MKTKHIALEVGWWLPLIVALMLPARAGLAGAAASPDDQIFYAAERGDVASIKTLLAKGAKVNARDKEDRTPLIRAAGYNRVDAVKVLLQNGADVNASSIAGETALIEASGYGYTEVVRLLLAKGAGVDAQDARGWSALRHAATEQHAETVKVLRAHGAKVSVITAAILGDLKEIERLVRSGADLDEKDEEGSTPLIEAVRHENVDAVRLLLEHGADPNETDNADTTPLMVAGLTGQLDVVKLLLAKGADLNAKDIRGWTALSYTGAGHGAVRRFLQDRAEVDQSTNSGSRARTAVLPGKKRRDKLVTGKLVKCSAEEITIQVSDARQSKLVAVGLRSSTAFAPFRRPKVGETVRVRYRERGGRKIADQVRVISPQQTRHLPPHLSSPERVVQAFVKAGFDIKSTQELKELRDTGDVNRRLEYYTETFSPGYDCYDIAVGYKIATMKEEANEARVKVAYRNIGHICPHSLDLSKQKEQIIIYHLLKEQGLWRISFPYGPPHVSVATAVRLAEGQTFDSPETKERIQSNIMTLKKYLEKHSTERREKQR